MKYFYVAFSAFILGGCSLSQLKLPELKIPRVYKLSVQQGNVITQEMVDRLKPGMTRNQVEFVMGKPVLADPFKQDQWVYIYTLEVPDYFIQNFKMVLTSKTTPWRRLPAIICPKTPPLKPTLLMPAAGMPRKPIANSKAREAQEAQEDARKRKKVSALYWLARFCAVARSRRAVFGSVSSGR